jgi:hypothetical protein
MPAAAQLLELSAAASVAARALKHRPRARLELAVAAVLAAAQADEAAAHKKLSPDQALSRLRQALDQCRAAGVDWPDVVAIVNREDRF